MRLHRLRISAFGPFAGTVDLDLESVGAAGLFLVHGQTGAGKTSILDAVCFALYAGVPGDRRPDSLRSHHAPADVATSVQLELTIAGRRLRIHRRPARERPKKRGTGTTTDPAKVELDEWVAGGWRSVSTRIDETAEELDGLLGMGLEQFRRVVLLPQGDFADFLDATDEVRREVLERLFDVSDYAGVEAWLTDRRQRTQADVARGRERLAGHVVHLTELLSGSEAVTPEPDRPWSELSPTELEAAVDEVDSALGAHSRELLTLVDHTGRRDRQLREQLESARRRVDLQRRGREAQAVLDRLADAAATHTERRHRLARGREAAAVLPFVTAAQRADGSVQRARTAGEEAAAALPDVLDEVDLETWVEEATADGHGLETARHEVEGARRRLRELAGLRAESTRRTQAVHAGQEAITAAREELAAAREAVAATEAAQERREQVSPELERLTRTLRAHAQVAELASLHRDAVDAAQRARELTQDRRELHQQLVQDRLDNMAGELARQLVPGEACAVCGSSDHPAPARAARLVTTEQIDLARDALDAATRRHEEADRAREEAASRLEVARSTVAELDPEGAGVEELRERHESLSDEHARLDELCRGHEDAARRVTEREAALVRAEESLARARREHAELTTRGTQLTEDLRATCVRMARALDDHARDCGCRVWTTDRTQGPRPQPGPLPTESTPTAFAPATAAQEPEEGDGPWSESAVAAWSEHTRSWTESLTHQEDEHATALRLVERARAAREEIRRARRHAEEASAELVVALEQHGFADADAVTGASLGRAELAELAAVVEEHDQQLATARAVLAEEDVRRALAEEVPDVETLRGAAREARHDADAAGRAHASAETVHRQVVSLHERIRAECAALGPALEEAELVGGLADLATGTSRDNDKRMRLSTYVLAARLERVVELANERLLSMADGRYELVHDDASAVGRRRGGLGLLVRDAWTGAQRPTGTLSGGESFTASLALALGLADAIREESGGREFGTLFVDEGFGSLDHDSLEQVLDVLDGLRDGGRVVGVVSHVAEMRTRIPARVAVHKGQQGSHVTVHDGADTDVA